MENGTQPSSNNDINEQQEPSTSNESLHQHDEPEPIIASIDTMIEMLDIFKKDRIITRFYMHEIANMNTNNILSNNGYKKLKYSILAQQEQSESLVLIHVCYIPGGVRKCTCVESSNYLRTANKRLKRGNPDVLLNENQNILMFNILTFMNDLKFTILEFKWNKKINVPYCPLFHQQLRY